MIEKTAAGLSLDRSLSRTLPASLGPGRPGAGSALLNMPKSTVEHRRAAAASLKLQAGRGAPVRAAPAPGIGVSCTTGTDTEPAVSAGLDIFGMRGNDDGDDFEDGAGAGGGGFWMPGASLPTPPRSAQPMPQSQARGPKEFFDGYNLWHEWESRTAGKPFWHCKETGETRWEKPTKAAVQEADKRPGMSSGTDDPGNLLDGTFDESANRRAFLQALYEWRNGGPSAGGDDDAAAPAVRPETQLPPPKPKVLANPALKNASKHEMSLGTALVPKKPQQRQESNRSGDAPGSGNAGASRPASGRSSQVRPLSAQLAKVAGGSKAPQSATLHAAAGRGGVALIQEIIAARADVNALDRFGSTALHYAAGGGHVEAVRLLLEHGASAQARSTDEDTPLHAAAKSGDVATVQALLEHGAFKDATNSRANTPQKLALMFGKADVARLLEVETSTAIAAAMPQTQPAIPQGAPSLGASSSIDATACVAPTSVAGQCRAGGAVDAWRTCASSGMSTDTSDLDLGRCRRGAGRLLEPRKWVGASAAKVPGAAGHSMACGDSDDDSDGVGSAGQSPDEVLAPGSQTQVEHGVACGDDAAGRAAEDAARQDGLGKSGVHAIGRGAGSTADEDEERNAARMLLEGLRLRAREEAEQAVEQHFSRPGTARSRPGTSASPSCVS
jgi:hypothetical protein